MQYILIRIDCNSVSNNCILVVFTVLNLRIHCNTGFAEELMKKTSGAATAPQLRFSHWGRLPIVSNVLCLQVLNDNTHQVQSAMHIHTSSTQSDVYCLYMRFAAARQIVLFNAGACGTDSAMGAFRNSCKKSKARSTMNEMQCMGSVAASLRLHFPEIQERCSSVRLPIAGTRGESTVHNLHD